MAATQVGTGQGLHVTCRPIGKVGQDVALRSTLLKAGLETEAPVVQYGAGWLLAKHVTLAGETRQISTHQLSRKSGPESPVLAMAVYLSG